MRTNTRAALIQAALDHAGDTMSHAFVAPIPGTTPALYVALGEIDQIRALLDGVEDAPPMAERGKGWLTCRSK
jgi:hypothetical protein